MEPAGDGASDAVPCVCGTARKDDAEFLPLNQVVGDGERGLISDSVESDVSCIESAFVAENTHVVDAERVKIPGLSGRRKDWTVEFVRRLIVRKQFRVFFILNGRL